MTEGSYDEAIDRIIQIVGTTQCVVDLSRHVSFHEPLVGNLKLFNDHLWYVAETEWKKAEEDGLREEVEHLEASILALERSPAEPLPLENVLTEHVAGKQEMLVHQRHRESRILQSFCGALSEELIGTHWVSEKQFNLFVSLKQQMAI